MSSLHFQKRTKRCLSLLASLLVIVTLLTGMILLSSCSNREEDDPGKSSSPFPVESDHQVSDDLPSLTATRGRPIRAVRDSDGQRILPDFFGSFLNLGADIKDAYLLPAQQGVICLDKDGRLFILEPKHDSEQVLVQGVESIYRVYSDGVFFTKEDNLLHRIRFADGLVTGLNLDLENPEHKCHFSYSGRNLVFWNDEGIFSLRDKDRDAQVVSLDERAYLPYNPYLLPTITEDGRLISYMRETDDFFITELIILDAENQKELAVIEIEGEPYGLNSLDSEAIWISTQETSFFISRNQAPVQLPLGYLEVWTLDHRLFNSKFSTGTPLYLRELYGSNADKLLYLSSDGARETVLTGVHDCTIKNHRLLYLDDDSSLYMARLSGSEIEDKTLIMAEIREACLSDDGQYIYYVPHEREADGRQYLWVQKVGDLKPYRIDSLDCPNLIPGALADYFAASPDGGSIYFLTDHVPVSEVLPGDGPMPFGEHGFLGTLKVYQYGQDQPQEIATQVLGSCSLPYYQSFLDLTPTGEPPYINPQAFFYLQLSSGEDGFDLKFYDGSKSHTIAHKVNLFSLSDYFY